VLSFLFSTPGVKGAPPEICFPLKRTEKSFISRFDSSLGGVIFLTDPSFHRLASFLPPADLLFSCCALRQPCLFPPQRVCGSRFFCPGCDSRFSWPPDFVAVHVIVSVLLRLRS
jgi:hypothetical protein